MADRKNIEQKVEESEMEMPDMEMPLGYMPSAPHMCPMQPPCMQMPYMGPVQPPCMPSMQTGMFMQSPCMDPMWTGMPMQSPCMDPMWTGMPIQSPCMDPMWTGMPIQSPYMGAVYGKQDMRIKDWYEEDDSDYSSDEWDDYPHFFWKPSYKQPAYPWLWPPYIHYPPYHKKNKK